MISHYLFEIALIVAFGLRTSYNTNLTNSAPGDEALAYPFEVPPPSFLKIKGELNSDMEF